MIADCVKKGVLYHWVEDAAFLIAGVEPFWRAAKG
jgi:hypothetical protein